MKSPFPGLLEFNLILTLLSNFPPTAARSWKHHESPHFLKLSKYLQDKVQRLSLELRALHGQAMTFLSKFISLYSPLLGSLVLFYICPLLLWAFLEPSRMPSSPFLYVLILPIL